MEINEDLQLAGHLDGIVSPEQGRSHLSNSPNPDGIESPVQVPNLSSSPSGNGYSYQPCAFIVDIFFLPDSNYNTIHPYRLDILHS
jgi:hypothetical protein